MHVTLLSRVLFLGCVVACSAASASDATAQTARGEFCAHGVGTHPDKPFSRFARVVVELKGPALDAPVFSMVAGQLVRAALWPAQADKVYLDPYDSASCPDEQSSPSRIDLEVSKEDIDRLLADVDRADASALLKQAADLVQRAAVRIAALREGTSSAVVMRLFYATDRMSTGALQVVRAFRAEMSQGISFGALDVVVPAQVRMRDLQSAGIVAFGDSVTDPSKIRPLDPLMPLPKEAWIAELRKRIDRADKPGILVFVHGYNVAFEDAARRAAQLSYDLAFPGATVFFAWPSDASLIKYPQDAREAENSGPALANVLSSLLPHLSDGPIYLVAHSMGNRVAINALLELRDANVPIRKAIREVVFAAPDVDQVAFRLRFAPKILDLGPRFTLYASQHDLALASSQFLQGGKRLGFGGADLYETFGLDSVDASAVTTEFFSLGHSYFGDKATVLGDLFFLIRYGLPPAKRPNLALIPGREAWRIQPQ